ncbi:MAG: pyruvate carboxylase [Megasphaera elsdenii]|uniref:Pyruvate carboxylase n=1 Tax=Megasphaera elsdenii TaxID=907 RepID=A0A2S0M516_MEGEL|nr:pyruvate carboxylase [Megasphaera elsdenii]AVO26539.1 pyruvate carboxylase [Megasphaera elsdenii]MCI7199627.1 pyruvate carboxylase [Megasphaera elsdenii]MDD7069634.1 pyruvate carboxylase [Megasphaera elsdenii]MDY4265230.1 pyruvate carboxylase [Megasphaera elsdenii]MDY5385927.1 pyruvate carboxylase [Megasphaera elsdenii]
MKKIRSVLVANRGEIAIRVFRACNELGIRTVAIYSKEDSLSLHRFRADESYLVGEGKKPVDAYLDIEDIIRIAHEHDVDAIHPGYGFLSENADLAKRCEEEGIIFIGPKVEHLIMFGDKINARIQAKKAGIQYIPGSDGPVMNYAEVEKFAKQVGFPIMLKAVNGGGGRGMRMVDRMADLRDAYDRAKSEAKLAFGSDEIYLEKCIVNPKHVEVQIMGDEHGNVIHLFERDCSIQRRHQKVVETAPASALPVELRQKICNAALKLMKNVHYVNAGTVEFLVTPDGEFYFIEVNPRVQVEHTVTEMITGIDIVQTQIKVAEGYALDSDEIGIKSQDDVRCLGDAIQCRITTEDPMNNFMPDSGKIMVYRSGGGFGVRLDSGNAYTGAIITPYYDSLLVKTTTYGLTHKEAAQKMLRVLKEFRIRGVKTNIGFLINVLKSPEFIAGTYNVNFIDDHPELFNLPVVQDRGTKLLKYIGDTTINGYADAGHQDKPAFEALELPTPVEGAYPDGTKQKFDAMGPEKFSQWIKEQPKVFFTDTTMRDAHQSLFATRVRSIDMLRVLETASKKLPNLFSYECWGGATFDVAYRFLYEDPWVRLRQMRKKAPNILLQMLVRGANAVGYTSYPDNVVKNFIDLSAKNGIDVFRVFDSLNSLDNMYGTIQAVRENNKLAEVALCYTGDILDPSRDKYDLKYYVNMAKELQNAGANIIAIKDMAGLLKPEAAYRLVSALKDAVDLPIHLHTHDGSGNAICTYNRAIDAGVDIVDVAYSAFAGGTSQPSMSTLYYALSGKDRQPDLDVDAMEELSRYWATVRPYYKGVDKADAYPNTEVYQHEMPGGQFSNLRQQAKAVGLGDRWNEIKKMYHTVSMMFGDIIKVTPSSKVVGDMALFMVQNNLTEQDVYDKGDVLDFPQSVVEFFEGRIGIPYQGFPEKLQKIVLKGKKPLTERPGKSLAPVDFEAIRQKLTDAGYKHEDEDINAYCQYPKVFKDFNETVKKYGDVSVLDTPTFFFGMKKNEEVHVEIEEGKDLIITLINISDPDDSGVRTITFMFNGAEREIQVQDKSVDMKTVTRRKADPDKAGDIGATLSGSVVKVLVTKGQKVKKGEPLVVTEAMKMETTITSPIDGTVGEIYATKGQAIISGDCLLEVLE